LCLANSKLLLIEDCGHFPWIEQAEELNALVPKFLQALGPAQPQ
jgi:pimeloyl-ACP methyl ester carboxylesterase